MTDEKPAWDPRTNLTHTITPEEAAKGSRKGALTQRMKGQDIRDKFLEDYRSHGSIPTSLANIDRSRSRLDQWRRKWPDFKHAMNEITEMFQAETLEERQAIAAHYGQNSGEPPRVPIDHLKYDRDSFEDFRLFWLKTETYKHQAEAVAEMEHIPLGNILMMLWPPDHGKTTLSEDYYTWKLVFDPQFRITVATEKQGLAKRILGRVRQRLEAHGPFPNMVSKFGPFSPSDPRWEGPRDDKVWNKNEWNTVGKAAGDERDYNMQALGFGSQVAGTRCDRLDLDDVTSLKNYRQTHTDEGLVETFQQDWISRPGEHGSTAIKGTRVGIDDFYIALQDLYPPSILKTIRKPALVYDGELKTYIPLWPERYDSEALEKMRIKVGEEAWARNWMQQPMAKANSSFGPEVVDPCKDTMISCDLHNIPVEHSFILTLDPSIGGRNIWSVQEITSQWIMPVWFEDSQGLTSYDQIFGICERLLDRWGNHGALCHAVILEENAFQKGLAEDPRLLTLQSKWGFEIIGHNTGTNKMDADIGVPAMPTTMRRGEYRIPWADDLVTREMMGTYIRELQAWRPYRKGRDLVQDFTVTGWFGHKWWQPMRSQATQLTTTSTVVTRGLPFTPTGSKGLLLPSGFRA